MKAGRVCTYELRCTDLWTCFFGPVCGIHPWVLAQHEPAGLFGVMWFRLPLLARISEDFKFVISDSIFEFV